MKSLGEKNSLPDLCYSSRTGAVLTRFASSIAPVPLRVALAVLRPMVLQTPGDAVMMVAAWHVTEMPVMSDGAMKSPKDAAMRGDNATLLKQLLPLLESRICRNLLPSLCTTLSQSTHAVIKLCT